MESVFKAHNDINVIETIDLHAEDKGEEAYSFNTMIRIYVILPMIDFKCAQDQPKERTAIHPPKRVSTSSTIHPPHCGPLQCKTLANKIQFFFHLSLQLSQVTIKVSTSLLRYYSNIFDHDANVMSFRSSKAMSKAKQATYQPE